MKSGKWAPTLIDIVSHCGRPIHCNIIIQLPLCVYL